jgi:hypothetical protein
MMSGSSAKLLVGCALLAGCVRVTTQVDFYLVESNGQSVLGIGVSKPGICTDVHGGCAEIYQFSFPANLSVVRAGDILWYRVNHVVPATSELPQGGEITLIVAPSGCELSVNLTSKGGKPLPVNGKFRQASC